MSRVTKWKLEKTKVKVVFRLQFHATHIPQTGWDKLFISFIPTDSGKATGKTTKAYVRNGTCKWADPIYETTRLLQDAKNKQFDEKLYKLVVSMGSSRASILGEAVINLADYADALKPSVVALPLHGCNFGTTLHVTVQLLTSKTGFREFEQQRELRDKGLHTGDRHDGHSPGKAVILEESTDQMDKVNARLRSTSDARELSSMEEEGNEECADSSIGFEGSSNTSESLYAEKLDHSSANDIDSHKDKVSGDMNEDPNYPTPLMHKGDSSGSRIMAHGSSGSVRGWSSDYSLDNDLAIANEENNRLRGNLELAESSIFELKLEVSSLQGQADEIAIETHKFSSLLMTEISSSEKLAEEVSLLKSECSLYKEELGRLRSIKVNPQTISRECGHLELCHLLQDTKLQWLKGILLVEEKIRELQRKTYLGFHERDSRFLHSELEALLNTLQDIKHGTEEATSFINMASSERSDVKNTRDMSHKSEQIPTGTGFDIEVCEPEIMLHHFSIPPLVSKESDSVNDIDAIKKNLFDLVRELDEAKIERDSLLRKMGQMECYYEALIQELEENQKQMLGELQNIRNEHSNCLYKISTSKVELEAMNEQILQLAGERRDLDVLNKELERKAATSEAALRRARLNYSIAVDRLQKDLELLSSQVVSMFATNENLIMQAFCETSQPPGPGSSNAMQNSEDIDTMKLLHCQNQNFSFRKQLGGDILLEDMKKSLCLQEELYQKVEEELSEMHSLNLQLDIFSKTLQETIREASSDFLLVIAKINELVAQLKLSDESKDLLIIKLQAAMDEVRNLSKYNATCTAKFNDMTLQNQILEAKVETISKENSLLVKKLADCEAILMECQSYQSQYEACLDEKTELSSLLAQETSVTSKLQNEMSILNEELVMLQSKHLDLNSLKGNLDETVTYIQEKMGNMLVSWEKHFAGLSLLTNFRSLNSNSLDCKDIVLQLEEIQHNACDKILQLTEENENLESERSAAVMSLSNIRSEFLATKKKFKNDMQNMQAKADVASGIVDNLQHKIESVASKLLHSSETEETLVDMQRELLADLSIFEVELQKLLSENAQLVQEISSLNMLSGELTRSELTISELIEEKQDLFKSLHDKTVESENLASDFSCMKENLRSLQDKLDAEEGIKCQLENAIGELTSQLNILQNKVHDFEALSGELEKSKLTISEVLQEKQDILQSIQEKTAESAVLSSEISCLNENFINLQDVLDAERSAKEKLESAVGDLTAQLTAQQNKLHDCVSLSAELEMSKLRISELIKEKQDLVKCLEHRTKESAKLTSEVSFLQENVTSLQGELDAEKGIKDKLELAVGDLTSQLNLEQKKLLEFAAVSGEHESSKMTISGLTQEKQDLLKSLRDQTAESTKLASEISCLEENLTNLQDELHSERYNKDKLECVVGDLTSQLNIEQKKLNDFTLQNAELVHLRQLVTDLELEKSRLSDLLLQRDKFVEKLLAKSSSLTVIEGQLYKMNEYIITEDVKNVFFMSLYETRIQELEQKLQSSDVCLEELQKKHNDVKSQLNHSLANESHYAEENSKFEQTVGSLTCELEVSLKHNRDIAEANNHVLVELDECRRKLETLSSRVSEDKDGEGSEAEELKKSLKISEDDLINLTLSNEELEITITVLKGKLKELHAYTTLLKESEDELATLRARHSDLSGKLSQQILRTEEFKNLSIHLKELKDKADAEILLTRERRESEGTSVAMQDSLRVAFIKEQYEAKLQELKQQLSISKKHGEDMLLKLQDSVDEIENRKRSEALHLKRNEELALKLLALEDELQSVLSDNREKNKAYDCMKAELECAVLSLECCKEEREILETSLRGCEKEKSRVVAELSLTKKQLEDVASSLVSCNEESEEKDKVDHLPHSFTYRDNVQVSSLVPTSKNEVSSKTKEAQSFQDLTCEHLHETADLEAPGGDLQETNGDHGQYHCNTQSLKSSIQHLQEELERMKNENAPIPGNHHFDSDCELLQNEIIRLEKANEELRNIFPLYNEISSTGNALERVLALEIELAEALRAKHKSKIHFQSSFLKQHGDEEAVLKSFKDINALIKEMLELKGKYSAVEAELKEMHDRYSQLSLQFAEVEGDRQKLKMTLKNVRASRKLLQLNRSSSTTNTELTS